MIPQSPLHGTSRSVFYVTHKVRDVKEPVKVWQLAAGRADTHQIPGTSLLLVGSVYFVGAVLMVQGCCYWKLQRAH